MKRVDYDAVAPSFDRRYAENDYGPVAARLEEFVGSAVRVLDVGCGTGYWTAHLSAGGAAVVGIDPSSGLLERGRARRARLVRGSAESLPFRRRAFDRLFCLNSLHHFGDRERFAAEAFRVIRPGGGLLVVGLDPHQGGDRWWIYDYFPSARDLDRERFAPSPRLRDLLFGAGFTRCETLCVMHSPVRVPAQAALDAGRLARLSTSQLALLSDEEYGRGMSRLRRDIADARARGEEHALEADLRVYATTAWVG